MEYSDTDRQQHFSGITNSVQQVYVTVDDLADSATVHPGSPAEPGNLRVF